MKKLLSLSICLMLVFSSIPAFALSYDDLLGKATTYSESDDYEKAFACYELAVRMEPKKTNAYIAASNLYYKIGQLTAAMESADTALSIDPTLIDAWLMKCRIDLANNDVAAFDSDAIYAEICGVDLIPYAAHIGVMYAKAGFFDKAAQQFSLFPIESMDEMQKEIYRRTLISLGHRDQAEAMGLLADNMRDKN